MKQKFRRLAFKYSTAVHFSLSHFRWLNYKLIWSIMIEFRFNIYLYEYINYQKSSNIPQQHTSPPVRFQMIKFSTSDLIKVYSTISLVHQHGNIQLRLWSICANKRKHVFDPKTIKMKYFFWLESNNMWRKEYLPLWYWYKKYQN